MRLVVCGDPIDHSLSPQLHTAALHACGLAGTYARRRVDADGLAEIVDAVRDGTLDGANVTMPHKRRAAEFIDRLAASAAAAHAVNTLVRSGNQVVGHNTDIAGLAAAWAAAGLPDQGPVLLLGAGGAAAGAVLALANRPVTVTARRPEAVAALAEQTGTEVGTVPWGEPLAGAAVVHATPLGMAGEEIAPAVLDAATGLFDMAYAPTATRAVSAMQSRGLPVADGRAMLLHQAAVAFELWTGRRAPLAAMAAALPRPQEPS